MDELSESRKKCSRFIAREKRMCSKYALPDSEYCWSHSQSTGAGDYAPDREAPCAADGGRGSVFPSLSPGNLFDRVVEIRNADDLMSMDTEVSILKALLERGLQKLEEELSSPESEDSLPEASVKRIQSLAMDILSAAEKCARVEERRRGVLSAAEIGVIIDRIKERVIQVVRTTKENDPPEQTARRIAEAFSSIEIVGCG